MQVAGWVLVTAFWLFFVTALIGFDAADWPARSTSVHNDPTANPMGIVGATLANWSLRAFGFTVWVLLLWALIGLIAILRGREITHPTLRIVGACLSGLALATLDVTWFGGVAGTPTAPGGLIPSYLSEHLQARFNGFGVSLWMLTAFVIGALIAGDELVLRLPNVLRRAGDLFNERIPAFFSAVAERISSTRGALRPAGGPAVDDLEDFEELEDEYEYEYEDEDEEEEDDEEEEEEEEEDEYDYEDVEEEEEDTEEEEVRPALTK